MEKIDLKSVIIQVFEKNSNLVKENLNENVSRKKDSVFQLICFEIFKCFDLALAMKIQRDFQNDEKLKNEIFDYLNEKSATRLLLMNKKDLEKVFYIFKIEFNLKKNI